jgi:hypothetical protein
VKFAVSSTEDGRAALQYDLRTLGDELGYLVVALDARDTRIHLIDRLFFAVAQQVDWDALTRAYLERLLSVRGFRLPPPGEPLVVERLAELNAASSLMLRNDLRRAVETDLFEDAAMTRELRLAMIQLCTAHLDPTDNPALEQAVKEWLRGELRLLSEVKRALIFQKIARHNARHMLFSLAYWLTRAGKSGLLLTLDINRYFDATRPADRGTGHYYSVPATMDLYETLRQLVDGTDEVGACFVGVLAGPDFVQDDRRGVRSYQALYFRIWDEVFDRDRENPLSSLVRLEMAA